MTTSKATEGEITMNDEVMGGDELTEDDLEFLQMWEEASEEEVTEHETGGNEEIDTKAEHVEEAEVYGAATEDSDADEKESGESDSVDETKMDISSVETEEQQGGADHLEGG